MKVFIAGSSKAKDEILEIQKKLSNEGFEVLNQFFLDYTKIEDFRDKDEICKEIFKNDLQLVSKADLVVLLATYPSFGAMFEAIYASMMGKVVVAYCPSKVQSPWPFIVSVEKASSFEELLNVLRSFERKRLKVIPNIYGEHETEFEYEDFRCICPVTGMEDRAKIKIKYIPKDFLLEYESLDEYFKDFKEKTMHHEAVVKKILEDVWEAIKPKKLEVEGLFERRSGISARVKVYRFL
ncbi:MAG: preQ(1) synthase [Archaeoglobaceae archaeon]|nr:preQ(1) synthase [Archaeoglobaceae archaeon]MCX8151568.1 preQ(1) synthase [Archaeoglobaceae archaeon]MDW8013154.1 preQ(1) synthase [Archaeoglobaceae archaeon]